MNGRYFLITLALILMTTQSYARSIILPPLPGQKTDTSQIVQKTESNETASSHEISLPAQTSASSESRPANVATDSAAINPESTLPSEAKITDSANKAQLTNDAKAAVAEEHESFIDMGKNKLPSINRQNNNQSVSNFNTSDLRIPIIESDEKAKAKKGITQQAEQVTAPTATISQKTDTATDNNKQNADNITQPNATANTVNQGSSSDVSNSKSTMTEVKTNAPVIDLPEIHPTAQLPQAPLQEQKPPQEIIVQSNQTAPDAAIVKNVEVQNSHEGASNSNVSNTQPQTPASSTRSKVETASPAPEVAKSVAVPINIPAKIENKNLANEPSHQLSVNDIETTPLTQDHIKFINDETVVFTLNDDDIELGKLTPKAQISLITGDKYIKLFWQNYKNYRDEMRKKDVDLFLAMYESYPPQNYDGAMDYEEASNQAFEAANSGKLSDLRAIINNYPVLQMRNISGDNLLNAAIESDNIDVVRLLLIHGIDMRATNFEGFNAFSIAQEESNDEALSLLNRAAHKNFK